jgi:hypothetical protein
LTYGWPSVTPLSGLLRFRLHAGGAR